VRASVGKSGLSQLWAFPGAPLAGGPPLRELWIRPIARLNELARTVRRGRRLRAGAGSSTSGGSGSGAHGSDLFAMSRAKSSSKVLGAGFGLVTIAPLSGLLLDAARCDAQPTG